MKKLHSLAFYALFTPVITLGASSLLAGQSTGQDSTSQQQSGQYGQDLPQSHPQAGQGEQSQYGTSQSNSSKAAGIDRSAAQSRMQHRGFLSSAPANGLQASNLIGAGVSTSTGESMGSVSDLIIDENGQVVAVIVGVGGYLGMGERNVAIGWDDVTRSGSASMQELKVNVTRESLRDAKEYNARN